MSVRLPPRTPKAEVDALANANYEALKAPVMRSVRTKLFGGGPRVTETDLDEAYLLGWHALCEYIIHGNKVQNLTGFLVNATYLRARDLARQYNDDRHVAEDLDGHPSEDHAAERTDDTARLNKLWGHLKDRLTDDERRAVTLCVLHGYKRPEAARILGVSENRIQKVMDSATKKMSSVVALIDTRGCGGDEWARLLRAYALGVLQDTDRDYERAVRHIDECATCRRYVMGLRGLAAILPPVGLPIHLLARESSILAHLYRVFAPSAGHGSATVAAGTAGAAGTAASGGGAAGVLGGGAAIKVAAVAIVAAATVGAATTIPRIVGGSHHRPKAAVTRTQETSRIITPTAPAALTSSIAHRAAASDHHAHRHHRRSSAGQPPPTSVAHKAVVQEFGVEQHHKPPPPSPSPQPTRSQEAEGDEFGFEKQN